MMCLLQCGPDCICVRAALAGIASLTVAPNSSSATWRVLRTGTGKVKSLSGRWSDFSSVDVTTAAAIPSTATAAADAAGGVQPVGSQSAASIKDEAIAAAVRLYYGVQWSQREVDCGESEAADSSSSSSSGGELEFEPVCAMPAPWIGQLVAP
jgi:hypothetical protein